jgi:transcriptional regulator with XRE-family HTH domain
MTSNSRGAQSILARIIGGAMLDARAGSGYSQSGLAVKLGKSAPTISKWESGNYPGYMKSEDLAAYIACTGPWRKGDKSMVQELLSWPDPQYLSVDARSPLHRRCLRACERQASGIWHWSPLIPGPLRTTEYAEHLRASEGISTPPRSIDSDTANRYVLLPTSALNLPVEYAAEQIKALIAHASSRRITLCVLLADDVARSEEFRYFHYENGVDCVYRPGPSRGTFSSDARDVDPVDEFIRHVIGGPLLAPAESLALLESRLHSIGHSIAA